MQLRIAGARRPMPERRRDQPGRRLDDRARHARAGPPPPSARGSRPPRRTARSCAARTARPQLRVADPEQHAHALRRRERQIEPGDPDRGSTTPAAARRPADRRPASTRRSASPSTAPVEPELARRRRRSTRRAPRAADVVVLDARRRRSRPRRRAPRPGRGSTWPGRPRACRSRARNVLRFFKPVSDIPGPSGAPIWCRGVCSVVVCSVVVCVSRAVEMDSWRGAGRAVTRRAPRRSSDTYAVMGSRPPRSVVAASSVGRAG